MKPRHRRLAWILAGLLALSVATALVLNAFRSNLVFFFTPTQVALGEAPTNRVFRVGGLVKEGSLKRDQTVIEFVITDTAKDIAVRYSGLLPDLFQEGKGVVAQGRLDEQGRGYFASLARQNVKSPTCGEGIHGFHANAALHQGSLPCRLDEAEL